MRSVYHPVGLPISPQRMAARWQVGLLTVILTQGRVLITAWIRGGPSTSANQSMSEVSLSRTTATHTTVSVPHSEIREYYLPQNAPQKVNNVLRCFRRRRLRRHHSFRLRSSIWICTAPWANTRLGLRRFVRFCDQANSVVGLRTEKRQSCMIGPFVTDFA